MKSVLFSRFFILLPWALIVIIMIDLDTKRTFLSPRPRPPRSAVAVNLSALPMIYAVTPTYTRPVQKAELTRLAQVFRQVQRLHWIVVEDSASRSDLVSRFLSRCGVTSYTHLHVFTPRRFKRTGMPRATEQRNAALTWLRTRRTKHDAGVVFFADDDNTYSLELFDEVRPLAIYPHSLSCNNKYKGPTPEVWAVTVLHGEFTVDMGTALRFAVNLQVILSNPRAQFKRRGSQPGMQESDFLRQITKVSELEPKANNCTRVSHMTTASSLSYKIQTGFHIFVSVSLCKVYFMTF
uniref:Galactosylgalactosylxylosylprotein 3-beta-glucuronosyltransferase n=1 Tax=Neogobius melanostomus TaxID=47308 RepID=A0A8C6SDU6_9GOBI